MDDLLVLLSSSCPSLIVVEADAQAANFKLQTELAPKGGKSGPSVDLICLKAVC